MRVSPMMTRFDDELTILQSPPMTFSAPSSKILRTILSPVPVFNGVSAALVSSLRL
jgi:hypothetical protein